MTRRVSPRLSKVWRYALVGSLAFSLGSAATVTAGPTISGFVGLADGENTAAINASRELSVSDAGASGHLQNIAATADQLAFDDAGNLKTSAQGTQTVNGTVNVGNLPATQQVSGSVSVANLPATQNVAGTVNVGNLPATQSVSGTVGISSSANTVKIDPLHNGRTTVLLTATDPGGTLVPPASGITWFLDVSPYERIRVAAQNSSSSPTPVVVQIFHNDGVIWQFDQYVLAPNDRQEKIYETVGASIGIHAVATLGATTDRVLLQVWGR